MTSRSVESLNTGPALAPRCPAPLVVDDCILDSEGVSTHAVSLSRLPGEGAFPTPTVFNERYGFQMAGIDAASIAAEVVDSETIRDRTDQTFVNKPMSISQIVVAEDNVSVAGIRLEFGPYPASLGLTARECELLEESCFSMWSHEQKITLCSLTRALSYAGTHTRFDILVGIKNGALQGWPGDESCIITELLQTPLRKTLLFFLAEGNLTELKAMVPGILAWGREQGCTHASLAGRFGWQRSFVREFGFVPVGVIMETSLV